MSRIHILKGFSDLEGALWVLKYHPELQNRKKIVQCALQNGYTVTDERNYYIFQLLTEWGIANSEQRALTATGEDFYSLWEMKENVAVDVLHGLQYGLWTQHSSDQNLASWAYQQVCNYLWEYQTLPKPQDLIAYVYDGRGALDEIPDNIANAFSNKSVNGAYDWLLPLDPPVLAGVSETSSGRRNFRKANFARRPYCSSALFLMGLNWAAREATIPFGDLIEIDDERRNSICRFCMIERNTFDIMLDEVLQRFEFLSIEQIGRLFVTINQEPRISYF